MRPGVHRLCSDAEQWEQEEEPKQSAFVCSIDICLVSGIAEKGRKDCTARCKLLVTVWLALRGCVVGQRASSTSVPSLVLAEQRQLSLYASRAPLQSISAAQVCSNALYIALRP